MSSVSRLTHPRACCDNHSAPGGFIQYVLYQLTGTGFVPETMDALVEGTAQAIGRAYANLQPGKLRLSQGMLWEANINRSPTSYLLNPIEDSCGLICVTLEMPLIPIPLRYILIHNCLTSEEYPLGLGFFTY